MQKHNGFAESIKERASMLLSMKESVSASSEQTMPGVAKVLSALMIPPSMSLSMDRISVGNGIRNGTIKLINSSASENVVLKPVSSSVLQTSVPNIRVLSKTNVGASSLLSDNVVQSPVNVTKEILSKRVVKRSKDVGIVGIIDVPPKRIKMLTVAKRVPLINTVGNQSKLTPFSPSQYQASFETVNAQSNDIQKSQSILEARLTSPASILANAVNVHAKSSKENGGSLHKMPPCTSTSDKSDINASGNSQRFLVNGQSKSGSDALKTFVPPRNLVLEFEKGVTRLAAVEPRTVTMVDVSTQVYMQESEEQYVKDLPIQSSTLHANTAELSGSSQPAAVKFVLVDTKDGKRMLAIPKQIISNYSGPKTFVIEGKAVKKEAEEPLELASTGSSKESSGEFWAAANTKCQPDTVPQIGASLTASCQNPAKVENIQNTLSNLLLGGSIPNVSTVVSRLSTETLTTSSCKKQSFQVRADTLSRKSDFPLFPVSLSGGNGVLARTVLEPNAISNTNTVVSDSLTLPLNTFNKLNGPFKNDSLYRSSSSLSQENFKSSNTPAEAFPNSLNSRPFVQAQPNASHVYVVVSNQGTKDPFCHQGVQNNFAQHVESKTIRKRNTSASDVSLSSNVWVKLPQASNSSLEIASGTRVTLSHKRLLNCGTKQIRAEVAGQELTQQCLDSGVSGKHEMRLDENSGSPMDSTDDSRGSGPLKENLNEDIEKYVRSAFADFRNCLVVNQGKLPIHEAVETNDYIALKRQCIVLRSRKVTVNILNSKEETPLQLALYHGHSSLVPLLLEYGADATVLDCDGNTTLHLAVRYAEDIVQVLLESGQIDKKLLNCFNDEGFTALHLASQDEKLEIISLLVKHGSDVNLPDGKSGRSALFHAVERKHYKAQKLLVSLGADSREANYSGSTPNHVTRVDAIAQLAGATAEDTIAEEISIETLLKSSSHH